MESTLIIKDVVKRYGKMPALNGLSFTIEPGQIVGLLGPNGSGKTTLIKLINTLMTDYTGEILVCGHKPGIESKKRVSYLPDLNFLRTDLKIKTTLSMFSDFFADFDREKAVGMLEAMQLDPNQRVSALSKGMKEKLQLVLVMSRAAKLYILDEPIAGVDPAARDIILETILKNFNKDASLLISTHLISDVENILDRVLFIRDGKIILDGMADNLREERGLSVDQIFREGFKC